MIATTKASNGLSEHLAGRRTKNGMEISPARTTRKGLVTSNLYVCERQSISIVRTYLRPRNYFSHFSGDGLRFNEWGIIIYNVGRVDQ